MKFDVELVRQYMLSHLKNLYNKLIIESGVGQELPFILDQAIVFKIE